MAFGVTLAPELARRRVFFLPHEALAYRIDGYKGNYAVSFHLSLSTETVKAAYPTEPLLVSPESTVGEVLRLIKTQRVGSAVVCQDDKPLGIFTERDALAWMASGESTEVPIRDLMSEEIATVQADATVGEVIQQMSEGRYRRMPILDNNGTPQGMASVKGIVHYLVDHFPQTIYTLPPTPDRAPSEREGA